MKKLLYHLTPEANWLGAQEEYRTDSLESEGFIHCSFAHQLVPTANLLFSQAPPLLVLCIDPARLKANVLIEDSYGKGEAFPHIYGTIPKSAVIAALPFPKNLDGVFELPEQIAVWEKG